MVKIKIASSGRTELKQSRKCKDYASVSRSLAEDFGLQKSQHVRIDNGKYATYYRIKEIHENRVPFAVHKDSLNRFNGDDGTEVTLSQTIPQETPDVVSSSGGVSEVLKDNGTQNRLLVIAPHGGSIEAYTSKIATRCYEYLKEDGIPVSLWKLQGYRHPSQSISSFRVWHFNMVMRSQRSYPQLQEIVDRGFRCVVGLHRSGYEHVEVGGKADRELREKIGEYIHKRTSRAVRTDTSNMHNPGTAGMVSENYLSDESKQAVHIECTPGLCNNRPKDTARAVSEALKSHL